MNYKDVASGSVAFVPSVAGLILAGINKLVGISFMKYHGKREKTGICGSI